MAENTKIEWAHHTFNPWEGCQKVGPGCDNCYAEARNARFGGGQAINWGPGAPRRRTSASNWAMPVKWNKQAQAEGTRYRVFCASLADVFDNAVDPAWRADLFSLILRTPSLDWLLLTKRIGNVEAMLPHQVIGGELPSNVWLGATVVNQEEADRDIPKLLAVPARVKFLSIEPMLERITTAPYLGRWGPTEAEHGIDWVIVGGESGPGARPIHPDWVRHQQIHCAAAGVPFLFKQWGEWIPSESEDQPTYRGEYRHLGGHAHAFKIGKKAAGRLLDGRTWDEVPTP